jgi:hypothetical protein
MREVTSTLEGLVSNTFASACISGGMVAEKEKCLPFRRKLYDHTFYIMNKSHVKHTIRFI